MELGTILQVVINGLLLGGIYMTIAVGLNLIYGVMRIVNYAQGEFMMIGMYIAFWLFSLLGISPYYSIPIVALSLYLIGWVSEKIVVEPVLRLPYESQVITFVGVIYVLQNLALILWTADYRNVMIPRIMEPIVIGGVHIPTGRLLTLIIANLSALGMYLLLKKTKIGKFIVATSQDPLGAAITGIDVRKIRAITFGVGLAVTGISACILLPLYYVFPYVGVDFGIIAFIIITLGGLGNFLGAVISSFMIGLIEALIGTFFSAELALAIAFLLFIVMLMLKPSGIMGE